MASEVSGRKPDASGSAQHVETCVHSRASGVMEDGGCETESRKMNVPFGTCIQSAPLFDGKSYLQWPAAGFVIATYRVQRNIVVAAVAN